MIMKQIFFRSMAPALFFGGALFGQPAGDALHPPAFPHPPAFFVPPTIFQTEEPIFPASQHYAGVGAGEADLVIKVGRTGALEDLLVTAYTLRPFADAAEKAVRNWTFSPAWFRGEAEGWVRSLQIKFRVEGIQVVEISPGDSEQHRILQVTPFAGDKLGYRAYTLRELDRIPVPRHVVAPVGSFNPAGSAKIVFYIDEQGRVRVPGVLETNDGEFANAALAAVSQWQFDPPTREGKPVLVHAVQTFAVKLATPQKE